MVGTTTSRRVRRSVRGRVRLRVGVWWVGGPVIRALSGAAGCVGDDEVVGGSGDGDDAPMVQPVVIGAHQHEVGQLGEAAVFPVPDVVGVQTAGCPAAGNHAGAVAVLERAAQPAADLSGLPPRADDLAVTFEPDLAGGVTGQVAAFVVREQRAQVQRGDVPLDVEMHDHGGALPVRPAGHLGVPAGLDQAHERVHGVGQRWRLLGARRRSRVVAFPVGDQCIAMRLQGGVERRRFDVRQA